MPSLSARSVVASTLLGTLPPRLAGHLLVALATEFGINPGTTRVALSRMVDRGELVRADDGSYALSGPLLERQGRQEAGLAPRIRNWTGDWEIHVVRAGSRVSGERAALRRAARHLGLREHRDGVWLRPDNLDPDRAPSARAVVAEQTDRFIGRPASGTDATRLAATLFDVVAWADTAARLGVEMAMMSGESEARRAGSLTAGFELAAEVLRHLVADPLLPDVLCPVGWPAGALRDIHDGYNRVYRSQLSAFLRTVGHPHRAAAGQRTMSPERSAMSA